jgi:hypothetical protein
LAASESNRALPPYQDGPVDRLGRGQQKVRVSSPAATRTAPGVQSPLPRRRRTFQRGAWRCRAPRSYPSPAFEAGCSAGCAHSRSYCAMNHLAQASLSSARCPDGCDDDHSSRFSGRRRTCPACWSCHSPRHTLKDGRRPSLAAAHLRKSFSGFCWLHLKHVFNRVRSASVSVYLLPRVVR